MPDIQCLPRHVADLIAAGEVVERPASVCKELLENAVDAGASKVTVEIRDGGMTFLRVTDNGCGIAPEQLPTAFLRHATSKLRRPEDLAAIGTAETIHAANRGENIAIIFINNAIYGMTGGQMAPTTLEGQKTATTPYGRRIDLNGHPLKIGDLLAQLEGTCYVTRQSVHTPAAVRKAKAAIRKAFENSLAGRGTSVVEIVSTCNSGWKMSPEKANQWMVENMFPFYPLGDLKNVE